MKSSRVNVGDTFQSKYGPYEILEKSKGKILIKFIDTGTVHNFHESVVYRNEVKDHMYPSVYGIGYLGAPIVADQDPLRIFIKNVWRGIFSRCYDTTKQNQKHTYRDCTVDKEWHNLQNFKSWCLIQMNSGFYQEGWELDKDLLIRGNKTYGPKTCVFLPERLNQLLQVKKNSEYNWLPGVNYDKARKLFKSEVNFDGKRYYLPRRQTELESFLDYKELKEKLVQADAENWKDKIHPRAYDSLKNYSLDWVLEEYLNDRKETTGAV